MRILICSGLLLTLSACSVEPIQPDLPPLDSPYVQPQGFAPQQSWWQHFGDAALNEFVRLGLQRNLDYQAAFYRLQQSQASWDANGSGQYPTLSASLNRNSSRTASAGTATTSSDSWSAGLSASYEIDFWGSIAAQKQQGEFQYLSTEAQLRTMSNTVAGEITTAWFGWNIEQQTLALYQRQIERVEATLKAIRGRYARGKVEVSDVWQQEQTLAELQGNMAQSKARLTIYQQTLALWLAMPVGDLVLTPRAEPVTLDDITKVNSESLQQRPDVLAAYFALQSAHAGVAVAQANRYPRFTLGASYTASDESIANVFDNWASNLVAGLVMPLIDGGARRAEVRRTEAVVKESIASYKQTLLAAAQEVEALLVNQQQQQVLVDSLNAQLALARKTQAFQERRYGKGVGDFIEMASAQQSVLQLERQVLAARWQSIQYRIQLYRALAQGVTTQPSLNNINNKTESAEVPS